MAQQKDDAGQPQEGETDEQQPQDDAAQQPDEAADPDGPAEQEPDGEADKPGSIDDLMQGLDDDARKLLRAELSRRDADARKARNEAKNLRSRLNEATPKAQQYDEAVEAQKTAEQKSAELNDTLKADNEGLRKRLVGAQVRVLASDRFADPDDAAAFLDPSDYLGDDLEPDRDAIRDALEDLLNRKPHLGKPDPKPRPPAPTKAQGAAGNGTPSVDQQIATARRNGNHAEARQLELSKLEIHS